MTIEIADRLIKLRKEHGYSQDDLAEKLNVSRQAISKWERGEALPDTENLIELAKLYNISLDELVGLSEPKKEENDSKNEKKNKNVHAKIDNEGFHVTNDENEVHINVSGIHIKDDEDEVHIDSDGVHLKDGDDEIVVDSVPGVEIRGDKFTKKEMFSAIFFGSLMLLATVAYVVTGFLYKEPIGVYGLSFWAIGWLVYLLVFFIESIKETITSKKLKKLNVSVLVTLIFVLFGMLYGIWHPLWLVFLFIPVYYSIVGPIDKYNKRKRNKDKTVVFTYNDEKND